MLHTARDGFIGLVVGVAGGIVAGILLAPKRRGASEGNVITLENTAQTSISTLPSRLTGLVRGVGGVMPDERISEQIRSELARRGNPAPNVDITTVDGVVYLRGREPDAIKADGIVAVAHDTRGVVDVIDEVKREA